MSLTIDPEFRALIPPLTAEERQQLEANLQADGCRDPLVVWNGVLLDGHHRYEICAAHGIAYQTVERAGASRDDAKIWIIRNQFGRRNLPLYVRAELALRLEPLLAVVAKARMLAGHATVSALHPDQNSDQGNGRTATTLGHIAGTSGETLYRVKTLQRAAPEAMKAQLRRGEMTVNHAYITLQKEGKIPYTPRARPVAPQPPTDPPLSASRKEERDLAGKVAALLAELRRRRKANHNELSARRWVPGNIVKFQQTEQLNWIETELERLVQHLREATPSTSPDRAQTARQTRAAGDNNGHQ